MNIWPDQRITEVADGIVVVLNGAGEVGVANSAFVVEEGRALVVDTMTFPEMADGIVRELARRGLCASMVLNTHHHIDHIGGNSRFVKVPIVTHPGSLQALERMGLPVRIYDHLMPRFHGLFSD